MQTYIVLDLEWNQSPTGKSGTIKAIPFEIIEIGAIKLDKNFNIIDEFKTFIKPVVYEQIHFRVHEIVNIGIHELKKRGLSFPTAMNNFFSWVFKENENPIFCTWGNMDLTELQRNMKYHNVANVFPKPLLYYDIQKLYNFSNDIVDSSNNKLPLDKACNNLGIISERPFHHALDDAYYTSMIIKNIDFKKVCKYLSIDYYSPPRNKSEEIYMLFPKYSKMVSAPFKQKEDIFKNKNISDIKCIFCKRMLKKKIPWFVTSSKNYYSLAYCPEHSFLQAKIRIKHTDNNKLFAIKTVKMINSKKVKELFLKKEEIKAKKKTKNNRLKLNKIKYNNIK